MKEGDSAQEKYGPMPGDINKACWIITKEHAELVLSVRDATRFMQESGTPPDIGPMIEELAQVAACCIRMMENLNKGRF